MIGIEKAIFKHKLISIIAVALMIKNIIVRKYSLHNQALKKNCQTHKKEKKNSFHFPLFTAVLNSFLLL